MLEVVREPDGERRPDESGSTERKLIKIERSSAEILLAITDLIVAGGGLPELFDEITPLIRQLTDCRLVEFSLCSASHSCVASYFWGTERETRIWNPSSFETENTPDGWVWKRQESLQISDLAHETRFADSLQELHERGLRSYMAVPMSSTRRRYGTLGIGRNEEEPADSETLLLLERAARLVALAVENHDIHDEWQQQKNRLQNLLEIGRELNSTLDFDRLLTIVFEKILEITHYDYARLALLENGSQTLRIRSFESPQTAPSSWTRLPLTGAICTCVMESRSIAFFDSPGMCGFSNSSIEDMKKAGIRSLCCVPLIMANRAQGALLLGAKREKAFSGEDGNYLQQVAMQIALAIHNANIFREVAQEKDRLTQEKRYLENEAHPERAEKIVGNSAALKQVLEKTAIVAITDATVLIGGETGTGKERVARMIHAMSPRRDRSFIKLNCAAIPTGLLESELFGHEKGAFTGAVSQKVGRLELADRGTLLLDEIGEIPLELQPKLLRVLQDQEFERLGGTKTIKVDVRVLAASNRDLAKAVEEGEFRADLFYRLNVFPLHVPPLRERREDIPLLIRHFVNKCATRLNKRITLIPDEAVEAMMRWPWPGNIRELENFIERSVILSDGERLRPPLGELNEEKPRKTSNAESTLLERERAHIIEVLKQTRGVLSGAKGASQRLGLKRTTLQHKMQKLGITRSEYLS